MRCGYPPCYGHGYNFLGTPINIAYQMEMEMDVGVLVGLTLASIERTTFYGNDALIFAATDGQRFLMTHDQDCCESVDIDDVCGDMIDLIGAPILHAEEVSYSGSGDDDAPRDDGDQGPKSEYDVRYTWTFYKFATIKGSVTVRWYGTSNGYYSESVDFRKMIDEE